MVVAEPPEPVAPLGNVQFLPGPAGPLGTDHVLLGSFQQMLARPVQRVPGRVVFLMANPDGEVMTDPTAGKQMRQGVARRMFFEKSADLDRLDIARAHTALIKGAEEGHTPAGIMLPAVLAVEDDTDQCRLGPGYRLADTPQVLDEVVGGRDRITALVMETDHVAQSMIAEDDGQLVASFGDFVRPVH